ncbi:MAG: 30S ribosome-binding factor RbfA [Ardenticatenia bacterium]|nr:30S ribosome-binding factor RbfA [Ardenticatenia bacterium]
MSGIRPLRLADTIQAELADILHREARDPRLHFLTITHVEVSHDLRRAMVHVSVLGSSHEQDETFEALKRARGFLRTQLAHRLRLRRVPELTFVTDRSLDHALRVWQLLEEVQASRVDADEEVESADDE